MGGDKGEKQDYIDLKVGTVEQLNREFDRQRDAQ
jgi:hypothetical protein